MTGRELFRKVFTRFVDSHRLAARDFPQRSRAARYTYWFEDGVGMTADIEEGDVPILDALRDQLKNRWDEEV